MGGGFNETALHALQRKFGVDVTPRAKRPDPMGAHSLRSTAGCPCSSCRFTAVCLDGCDRFKTWVTDGTYPPRVHRPPSQHKRTRE
jgi:hypothetical protein